MTWAALQFEYTAVLLPYLILYLHLVFVFSDVKNNIFTFFFQIHILYDHSSLSICFKMSKHLLNVDSNGQ